MDLTQAAILLMKKRLEDEARGKESGIRETNEPSVQSSSRSKKTQKAEK